MAKKKTFYITTPLYYPSGNLHIGHILTTTLAWVYRNFKKQQGYKTLFLTGIDEHGMKIEKKAKEAGIDPKKFVNLQSKEFIKLWQALDIDYDIYARTTSKKHENAVQKIFYSLREKGIIYLGDYSGLYSINDEEFFTKTQAIKKDGKYYHPTSGHELVEVKEKSYFFSTSKFGHWIKKYFQDNPEFSTSKAIINELLNNFINPGLEDLSVTRQSFDWGIKIKDFDEEEHIIYVWLDALFSYLTGLDFLGKNNKIYEEFWEKGTERVHVLGKEISRFHLIYWPIFLKALDLNLPTKEVIQGWIITPEGKMSKSKGNVISPYPLIEKYGAEKVKYFFASQVSIDSDFTFSEELMINVLNADLANNFGNLVNRTCKMINNSFSSGTAFKQSNLQPIDIEIYQNIDKVYAEYKAELNEFHADKAIKKAIAFSSKLNEYIDKNEPWKLTEDLTRLNVILNTLLNGIYAVNFMLSITMPKDCAKVNEFLSQKKLDEKTMFDFYKFDGKIVKVEKILFPRIK
ncbi:methionyl-tRNA synthetase [Metamycoplasma subdolum]|uniref:Methionine--tRNA ligase n=1 Tax=Metamycoplasma subdolum TaxID=92407 RepID=A0A3L9ZZJ4_9BACT|nr:methionine--tRNA ligase [Metamycoplasma subdolum]RMA77554.1 methionyl-tRNA synthetase [Metamycoplasma subdolum]WPB50348.1 methionine--tRNA ligase [Metamycoplasma subdolum]